MISLEAMGSESGIDAALEYGSSGDLVFRWEIGRGSAPVDVGTGNGADHTRHVYLMTAEPGRGSLRFPGATRGRLFVSLTPRGSTKALVVTTRRLQFQGLANFRDIGGYQTRFGRRIRWGLIYRSEALRGLSQQDRALYDSLEISAVYDLRGSDERCARPNPVRSQHVPIDASSSQDRSALLKAAGNRADGERILRDLYVRLVHDASVAIGTLMNGLSEARNLPAVLHCHGGKDRTGVIVAVLLAALGVDRVTILHDYELTSRYRPQHRSVSTYDRLVASGMRTEAAAGVLGTPRWAMQSALEAIDLHYGGVEPYLLGSCSLSAERLQELRGRLLVE